MSHKGWRRSIYTAWAEAAHITIASLKDLMSFFHIRLFIISPLPLLLERSRGEMYSVLPIAMIGKSLNHRLSIYQRSYNFAPNFKKNNMIMNYSMITWCIIAAVLLCAFIFRAVAYNCAKLHGGCCRHKSKHFFELGRDTDIFYVPGDDEIPGKADKTDESDGR